MNASSWKKLSQAAIKRLAARYSQRLTLLSAGDRGGWWSDTYVIAPRREFARAGADHVTRFLRLSGQNSPGDGRGALLEVGAGAQMGPRSRFITIAYVSRDGLDVAIDRAIEEAMSMRSADLTESPVFERPAPLTLSRAVQVL